MTPRAARAQVVRTTNRGTVARELMQVDPLTVVADTPFLDVQRRLVVAQIGGAPVVDGDGKVVGIISIVDLLRTLDQLYDDDLDSGEPSNGASELARHLGGLTAVDVATPEVVWVHPETPVSEAARLMRTHGIHRVLVGAEGRLEGILTAFDLLGLLEPRA